MVFRLELVMVFSNPKLVLVTGLLLGIHPIYLSGQTPSPVPVPPGPAITLDGQLEALEWEGSARLPLSSHGEVFLHSHEELLSVGVRGPGFGLAHLALASRDTVWILHASAALGSIVYARDGGEWKKVQDPTWEVRDPSMTPEARARREAYLTTHHWVGTTGRMGAENEVEFLIRMERFGGGEIRLAVVFYPVEGSGPFPRWPVDLRDGVVEAELLTGPMPERLHFDPRGWGRIR
jgi:hypothetical protein